MNTRIQRAALAASLLTIVVASGCASLDNLSTSFDNAGASQSVPLGDERQPLRRGEDPLLHEMAAESQLGN